MDGVEQSPPARRAFIKFILKVCLSWENQKAMLFGYNFEMKKPSPLRSMAEKGIALAILVLLSPVKLIAGKVQASLRAVFGGALYKAAAGGSAMPGKVEDFLRALGIRYIEAYGMTKTSAIVSLRDYNFPVPRTVGKPLPGYSIKLKTEEGVELPLEGGQKGVLWIKSEQLL